MPDFGFGLCFPSRGDVSAGGGGKRTMGAENRPWGIELSVIFVGVTGLFAWGKIIVTDKGHIRISGAGCGARDNAQAGNADASGGERKH